MNEDIINNIKKNIESGELNSKVQTGDPVLTQEEKQNYIDNFYKIRTNKFKFKISSSVANIYTYYLSKKLDKDITIEGLDKLDNLDSGAIITSNHFNPIDNMIVRKLAKKLGKDLYVVSQDTNLAMEGFLGYLMNYMKVIPLSKGPNYIKHKFLPELKKVLDDGNLVLIYPEEEMWLNYRLPRPCKRGTYYFAKELNTQVISCFTKIDDNNKYTLYILDILKPNLNKPNRIDTMDLAGKDYNLKVKCYEKVYNKQLDYTFSKDDIAKF